MFGLGACLLILVALTAVFGLFIKHLFNVGVTVVVMVLQITGGKGRMSEGKLRAIYSKIIRILGQLAYKRSLVL